MDRGQFDLGVVEPHGVRQDCVRVEHVKIVENHKRAPSRLAAAGHVHREGVLGGVRVPPDSVPPRQFCAGDEDLVRAVRHVGRARPHRHQPTLLVAHRRFGQLDLLRVGVTEVGRRQLEDVGGGRPFPDHHACDRAGQADAFHGVRDRQNVFWFAAAAVVVVDGGDGARPQRVKCG